MFPFKFEVKEAFFDYLSNKYGQNVNETKTKVSIYVFATYLSFLDYENKTEIFSALKSMGKDYYIVDGSKEQYEYLKSLPPVIYTNHMFDDSDYKLMENLGFLFDKSTEIVDVHAHIVSYMEKKSTLKKYVLPWLKSLNNFKYWTGIVASRAYRTSLTDYERIHGIKLLESPGGAIHKQLLGEILQGKKLIKNFRLFMVMFITIC